MVTIDLGGLLACVVKLLTGLACSVFHKVIIHLINTVLPLWSSHRATNIEDRVISWEGMRVDIYCFS